MILRGWSKITPRRRVVNASTCKNDTAKYFLVAFASRAQCDHDSLECDRRHLVDDDYTLGNPDSQDPYEVNECTD